MKHRRDLYLAILHEPGTPAPPYGWAYAVVTDGDLNTARAFASRDAAVLELRRPASSAPLGFTLDLGRPGIVAERIAGMTEEAAAARASHRQESHDAALTVNADSTRGRVLDALRTRPGQDFTLADAVDWYSRDGAVMGWPRASESSVRSRVAELVRAGYVDLTGERRRLPSGRFAALHRLRA